MLILVFLTCLFPAIGLLFSGSYLTYNYFNLTKKKIPYKEVIIIFAISIASFGYGLVPIAETDLTRYFDMVLSYQNMSFLDVLKKDKSYLYTRDLLFYFVNKTEDVHLLPFIVGINIYSICGYILYDQIKRSKRAISVEEFLILITISFSIITPYSIIGNVRCVQSYILISFGAYREFIQKKKNIFNYVLYFTGIGLHSTTIILVLIRYTYWFFKKIGILAIFLTFMVPFFIDFAYQFNDYYPSVIQSAVWTAHHYLHWTDGGWAKEVENSISNKVIRLYGTFYLVSVIIIFYIFKKITRESILNNKMVAYLYGISIFALASLSIKTGGFWRFEAIPVLFSSVYLMPILEKKNKKLRLLIFVLFFSAIMMGLLNIIFVLRNIIFFDTFGNMLTLTGIKVFISVIKGFLYF